MASDTLQGKRISPNALGLAVVFAATLAAFWPTLSNGFLNWDDEINFLSNFNYRGLDPVRLKWMWTTLFAGHYQPLSWMSLACDYLVWGMDPAGYHFTSLVLHIANAVLFYLLSRRLLKITAPGTGAGALALASTFAALFFSIHPLRVESVAWASERRDVLSGLFYLATLHGYLNAFDAGRDPARRGRWLAVAWSFYVLSLSAKSMGVTLPLVLLLLDAVPLRRLSGGPRQWFSPASRPVWLEKAAFALPAAAAGVIALIAQRQVEALDSLDSCGVVERVMLACWGAVFYLWKTLLPIHLLPLYEKPPQLDPWAWRFVLSACAVAAISTATIRWRRRSPAGLAAWAYYLVVLLPVSGIVLWGRQLAADRYTYMSCLPWALLGGAAVIRGVHSHRTRGLSAVFLAAIIAVLGAATWRQSKIWHDSQTLWEYVLAHDPKCHVAHGNLGALFLRQGRTAEAIAEYRQAAALRPDLPRAHNELGAALAGQGRWAEAVSEYMRALALSPDYPQARNNLGVALASQGRTEEAIPEYTRALMSKPDFADAHSNLGAAWASQGRMEEAVMEFRQALLLAPGSQAIQINLRRALEESGQPRKKSR